MRVGVIQSNYVPWRGYFDLINSVDLFVFHDDLQYTKQDWRNRNKLKTPVGTSWITVPVKYKNHEQLICDTQIDYSTNWRRTHLNVLRAYEKAPYYEDAVSILGDAFRFGDGFLSSLNVRLIKAVCRYFGITTPFIQSSTLNLQGAKTERLIDLLTKTKATSYLSGPRGADYIKEFPIPIEYKKYDYDPYPQLWGAFDGAVSILDLIANCGPDISNLRSK